MSTHKIIFDCERMKYPFTGLYSFCYQLGSSIKETALPDRDDITFYARESNFDVFPKGSQFLKQKSLHKFIMPSLAPYDIWHSTFQSTQYFPFYSKIKIVLTIHDLNFLYDTFKTKEKIKSELKKLQKKIDRADVVVSISEYVSNDIKKHFILKDKPIHVIHNGCNLNQSDIIISPLNIPKGKFIYTVGTITDKKNFHVLPALLAKNDMDLVISGVIQSQQYFNKIQEEAQKHNVLSRLIFTGPVTESEKNWYMKNCDVFAFPSLAEGFGLPVIEAMSYGKLVMLSTHTALPEIGGEQAYYFESFFPEEMQKNMTDSIIKYNQKANHQDIISRAASFNWKTAASKYLDLYRSL